MLHPWVTALGRGGKKTSLQKMAVKTSKPLNREGQNKYNCHKVLYPLLWKMNCVRWRERLCTKICFLVMSEGSCGDSLRQDDKV